MPKFYLTYQKEVYYVETIQGGCMKKSALLLLCTYFSGYAADMPVEIPLFIDIPYFANVQAFSTKTPTKVFTVVLTPATTLLDVQQAVHDKVGAGFLIFGTYKQFTFEPEPINKLNEKNIPLGELIKTDFFEEEDIDDPLNAFFFIGPTQGKTKSQPKQPTHLNKKAAPQI
jgi:hypothetical protein